MRKIKITKAEEWNWYNVGEEYIVKDSFSYQPIGVQVVKFENGKTPDVVENGHFEYIREEYL